MDAMDRMGTKLAIDFVLFGARRRPAQLRGHHPRNLLVDAQSAAAIAPSSKAAATNTGRDLETGRHIIPPDLALLVRLLAHNVIGRNTLGRIAPTHPRLPDRDTAGARCVVAERIEALCDAYEVSLACCPETGRPGRWACRKSNGLAIRRRHMGLIVVSSGTETLVDEVKAKIGGENPSRPRNKMPEPNANPQRRDSGGNLATASPISDLNPVFWAANALLIAVAARDP
ncbi:hypothetical protein G7046_g2900 [Stylonectria norvegica]|nr:hypothetical protein G7046_g2900 [Stylonectria norvegica]